MSGFFELKLKIWIAAALVGIAVAYFLYPRFKFQSHKPPRQIERQEIPPAPVLEMPSPVPLPVAPFQPHHAVPPPLKAPNHPVVRVRTIPRPPKPTRRQIIDHYRQVIALDDKYYQIAVDSDQYGYANQAILYYKKYLFIAPTGPHAGQIRQRLAELESQ